jgi:hypothetical protein
LFLIQKAQLSLLTMDDNDVGKAHFNLDDLLVDKNKKSKKNKKKLKDNEDGNNNKDDFEVLYSFLDYNDQ